MDIFNSQEKNPNINLKFSNVEGGDMCSTIWESTFYQAWRG